MTSKLERRGDLRLRHHHQDVGPEVRERNGRGVDQRAEERSARDGHHGPKSSSMVSSFAQSREPLQKGRLITMEEDQL